MIFPKNSVVITAAVILAGCAADYTPSSSIGGVQLSGYTDNRINANTAVVNFNGNRFTSPATLRNYLLYRCAEVTIENGYDYFVITSTNLSASNVNVSTIEANHDETIPPKVYPVTYHTSTYNTYGVATTHTQQYAAPNAVSAVIKMFSGPIPAGLPRAYNARDVIGHIGASTL